MPSLNGYLNKEVEKIYFSSTMQNIMEKNLSNNINNVVKNSVSADEDVVLMNEDVHDRSELGNEWVTKDADLGNMPLLNEDIMLKYLCKMRIALERMSSKEVLISKEDVQMTMKENDVVHQMQFDLQLNMIEDVGYLPEFQAKIMKEDTNDKEYFFSKM